MTNDHIATDDSFGTTTSRMPQATNLWPAVSAHPGSQVRTAVVRLAAAHVGDHVSTFVGKTLAGWGLAPITDDVELCARELVGNVVRHTKRSNHGPDRRTALVALRHWPDDRLRVEVSDRDERRPVIRRPADDESSLRECGRGMGIVLQLADTLSWEPATCGGKTVWCEFDLRRGVVG